MSAALLLIAIYRLGEKEPASLLRNAKVWAMVAIYAISLAGVVRIFLRRIGVRRCPMAPYGSMTQTSPLNLRAGAPGLLFDQEYGLLALAPVYILAATGLVQMWQPAANCGNRPSRSPSSFWRCSARSARSASGGAARRRPAGRSRRACRSCMLPIAAAFRAAPMGSARRAAQHLLLWISIGIAHHADGLAGRPADQQRAATARRRCSDTGRRDGNCGRWRRPSSGIRGHRHAAHAVVARDRVRGRVRAGAGRGPRAPARRRSSPPARSPRR